MDNYLENIIILNWGRICRICLSDESTLFPIIELDDQYKMSFCKMLNMCSDIKVTHGDSFPQLICLECIRELCCALEFKMKCHSSDDTLKKLLLIKEDPNNIIKCEGIDVGDSYEENYSENDGNKKINILKLDEDEIDLKEDIYYSEEPSNCENMKSTNNTTKMLQKTSENIYECLVCQKIYSSSKKLTLHKKSHTNTCWTCNLYIKNDEEYKEHLKNHDTNTCPECGKTFKDEQLCKRHMKVHDKDKHLCMTCGKRYCSISALSAHIRIHTGEKRYECNYCGKKFMHWSARRYHVRSSHTLERPYLCGVCDNRYIDKASLVLHIRNHTGEKPYVCNLCDMRFKGRKGLRTHMYSHTGQKRVFCEVCNKGFAKNYNLKMHMVTHTGEKKHICLICSKTFTQAHALRTHMKLHPTVTTIVENQDEEVL